MTTAAVSFLVRETAGLRRVLYPMTGRLAWDPGHPTGPPRIRVVDPSGQAVPCQVDPVEHRADGLTHSADVTFPVSLGPGDTRPFRIIEGGPADAAGEPAYDDPIALEVEPDTIGSRQKQVAFTFHRSGRGLFQAVESSGMAFIAPGGRGLGIRTADDAVFWAEDGVESCEVHGRGPLAAGLEFVGRYPDDRLFRTTIGLTALKSWARVWHAVDPVPAGCHGPTRAVVELIIELRLAVAARVLYDAGVGGWTSGALAADQAAWIEFGVGRAAAEWQHLTRTGPDVQTETRGHTPSSEAPRSQWFHWLDHPKSLAVAIPTPTAPGRVVVEIDGAGGLRIRFRPDPASRARLAPLGFGAVFHFLQDLPHVAARTSPQSILCPPVLEVETTAAPRRGDAAAPRESPIVLHHSSISGLKFQI